MLQGSGPHPNPKGEESREKKEWQRTILRWKASPVWRWEGVGWWRWREERTLHVSCDTSGKDRNPSARAVEAWRCELLFTCQLKLFFTPDICVGSPSCPQIESQILLFLFLFFPPPAHIESANKQGRGPQHPRKDPVVQQIIFLPPPPTRPRLLPLAVPSSGMYC